MIAVKMLPPLLLLGRSDGVGLEVRVCDADDEAEDGTERPVIEPPAPTPALAPSVGWGGSAAMLPLPLRGAAAKEDEAARAGEVEPTEPGAALKWLDNTRPRVDGDASFDAAADAAAEGEDEAAEAAEAVEAAEAAAAAAIAGGRAGPGSTGGPSRLS